MKITFPFLAIFFTITSKIYFIINHYVVYYIYLKFSEFQTLEKGKIRTSKYFIFN